MGIDADVVCLQELSIDNPEQSVKDSVAYIAEGLGFNVHSQIITLDDDTMKLANAIFSRFPLTGKKSVWINEPTGTGKYDDEYRAYVEACIEVEGQEIKIGTVHMSYTHAFEPTDRKLEETDKLVDCIKDNRTRYVLTGDFNAQPNSEVIQKIQKYITPADSGLSTKTWTTKPFDYEGFKADALEWRLDYVFATDDLSVLSSEIISTEYSDHLPILVKLEST